MSLEKPNSSSDPVKLSSGGSVAHHSRSVMIARIVGILCVAGGFMLGIQALDQPGTPLLPTALGLIVTGLVAQVFALVRSWYLFSHRNT
jgi:hypothetical protein